MDVDRPSFAAQHNRRAARERQGRPISEHETVLVATDEDFRPVRRQRKAKHLTDEGDGNLELLSGVECVFAQKCPTLATVE